MVVKHKGRDITACVNSMIWGGSTSEVARKLELKIVNAPLDPNISAPILNLADEVYLYGDKGEELFRGYVIDREASSVAGSVTYVAYDLLYYTLKSNISENYRFRTAGSITQKACGWAKVPVGELAETAVIEKMIVQNKSIYDVIMQAYTIAHNLDNKSYCVTAREGKLNVEEMGKRMCSVPLTEGTNITSSIYKETLGSMVNRVALYNSNGLKVGTEENKEDLKYGVFQQVYSQEEGKDLKTTARGLLHGIDKTFELQCVNNNEAITGAGVTIQDTTTGLKGLAWIVADTHTWTNGVATMSLTIALQQMMDVREG